MITQQPGKVAEAGVRTGLARAVRERMVAGRDFDHYMLRLDRLATIGTLSASMAHEIKNALVAGKTFIDLLLEKQQDTELVGIVRREMARIDSLVSGMLKFAGPERPLYAPTRLHEVLDHSLKLVQPQLDDQSIGLSRSFQAADDEVNGDDFQLQQAFVNLFLNAVEAMGPNGTLTVETQAMASGEAAARLFPSGGLPPILITIRDTGHGIAPEHMNQLFQPFFTTKPEGTGLGLAITRHIIQEHGGVIEAESKPGSGTLFRITLPALAASA